MRSSWIIYFPHCYQIENVVLRHFSFAVLLEIIAVLQKFDFLGDFIDYKNGFQHSHSYL